MQEAQGHGYVGSEHLLLGLLNVRKGVASQVLRQAGVDCQTARAMITEVLDTPYFHERTERCTRAAATASKRFAMLRAIRSLLRRR